MHYLIINKFSLLFFYIILSCNIIGQTDWKRWEKSDRGYEMTDDYEHREYNFSIESLPDIIVKPVINAYWFFISDVDGANCPFHPSCSAFLVQSIKETNPVQGTLMFFDRFTRDTNVFGRLNHYPRYGRNLFYDPVSLYLLEKSKIIIIPVKTFVNDEN